MDHFVRDVRHSVRSFLRTPGFTLIALLALALGIGANTAIFSVVNAVLLKPAPYPEPDRLVMLTYTFQGSVAPLASPTKFNLWREQRDLFQNVAAVRFDQQTLTTGGNAETVHVGLATSETFDALGARFAAGRAFTSDEDRPGDPRVAVLGHGLWQQRFGGMQEAIGATVVLDGQPHLVVGIVGSGFDTTVFGRTPDVWIPLQVDPLSQEHPPSMIALARLRPGIAFAAARARAKSVTEEFRRRYPQAIATGDQLMVEPLVEVMVRNVKPMLFVFSGAVMLVMLVACANVANLLLARLSARSGEMAIRAAVGASRVALLRQLLTEAMVLSLCGGVLGLVFGVVAIRALTTLSPSDIPRLGSEGEAITVDWRVLLFTVSASITTVLLSALGPVLYGSNPDVSRILTEQGGRAVASARQHRTRSVLIVAEVALALMLLVGAGLLVRTFVELRTVHRGFDTHNISTLTTPLTNARFASTPAVTELVRRGRERIKTVPGVVHVAAVICCVPFEADWRAAFRIVGRPSDPTLRAEASERIVSPEYFEVLGLRTIRGRVFSDSDGRGASDVAVINQAMARQFWPEADPLSDRLLVFPGLAPDDEPARQIVGIVADVKDGLVADAQPRPTIYIPMAQLLDRENAMMTRDTSLPWLVRTVAQSRADSRTVQEELRRTIGLPASDVRPLDDVLARAAGPAQFTMVILVVFGCGALLLAAVGVYGVMSYTVQLRTREIGIRLALGATPAKLRNMVLLAGMRAVAVGAGVGLVGAFALTGFMKAMLFGVTPRDPWVFFGVLLLLVLVALVAAWLPVVQITRSTPLRALRTS